MDESAIKVLYDVFLSYSRKDEETALAIRQLLTENGLRVWWDRDLYAGDDWRRELVLKVAQSRKVLVLWSPDSVTSTHVRDEAEQGVVAGKLIAFMIRACQIEGVFARVQSHKIVDVAAQANEIITHVGRSIGAALPRYVGDGVSVHLPGILAASSRFFGRDNELTMLLDAWRTGDKRDRTGKTNVVALTAMGGAGKTALLQRFRDELAEQAWGGATRVYGWSAYSQGSHENKQASSELFLAEALRSFGEDPSASSLDSPRKKAQRLAEVMQAGRTLLILDGLEPLQHPSLVKAGRFKDDGLDALITALANYNPGLLVVTSRQSIVELPSESRPRVILHDLGPLDAAAAITVLEDNGVVGRRGEIEKLAKAAAGHALTLNLLGSYIALTFGGDIGQIGHVRFDKVVAELEAIDDRHGQRARAMLRFYEARFAELAATQVAGRGRHEIAILSILGLFDRPAPAKAIDALLDAAIPGLTAELAILPPQQRAQCWRAALARLRDLRLVSPEDPRRPGELDAHPLIREHFSSRLEAQLPASRVSAHSQLFDHFRLSGLPPSFKSRAAYGLLAQAASFPHNAIFLKRAITERKWPQSWGATLTPSLRAAGWPEIEEVSGLLDKLDEALKLFLPGDIEGMAPLVAAIGHAAGAGRQEEAYAEVYRPRILRGSEMFIGSVLGAHGLDLAALANFFDTPWSRPAKSLSPRTKALVLNGAGSGLYALGRLRDAADAGTSSFGMAIEQQDWSGAAKEACNLSGLQLNLGKAEEAIRVGRESVRLADRADEEHVGLGARVFERMAFRIVLADTLLQTQGAREAAQAYAEAEQLVRELKPYLWVQTELQPDRWKSFATLIYHFCDYLLAQGRASDVVWCARRAIGPARASRLILPVALNMVCLGRALTVMDRAKNPTSQLPYQRLRDDFRSGSRSELVPWLLGSRPDERAVVGTNDGLSDNPADILAEAVDGLRRAGKEQFLPVGLLARAAFLRRTQDFDGAQRDIIEADAVAVRGDMARWQIDCHLERARLLIARLLRHGGTGSPLIVDPSRHSAEQQASYQDAEICYDNARRLIAATGLRRRDPELVAIRACLDGDISAELLDFDCDREGRPAVTLSSN